MNVRRFVTVLFVIGSLVTVLACSSTTTAPAPQPVPPSGQGG
jgi:hypothetical protein